MKVVKAAAQVLNTLWQYRDLRTFYKKVHVLSHCSVARDPDVPVTSVLWDPIKSAQQKILVCAAKMFTINIFCLVFQ